MAKHGGLNWDSIADAGGDILDSRELEDLRQELEDEKDAAEFDAAEYAEALEEWEAATEEERADMEKPEAPEPMDPDRLELLKALEEFRDEVGDEWRDGVTLVAESHFKEYAEQFAEDIGAIPDNAEWPCTCIDWEKAADDLRSDYTGADLGGTTYYFRA